MTLAPTSHPNLSGTEEFVRWIIVGVFTSLALGASLIGSGFLVALHKRIFMEEGVGRSNVPRLTPLILPKASKSLASNPTTRFRLSQGIFLSYLKKPYAYCWGALMLWLALAFIPIRKIILPAAMLESIIGIASWCAGLIGSAWFLVLLWSLIEVIEQLGLRNVAGYASISNFKIMANEQSIELASEFLMVVRVLVLLPTGLGLMYALSSDEVRESLNVYLFNPNMLTLSIVLGIVLFLRSTIGGLELVFSSKFQPGDTILIDGIKGRVQHVGLRDVSIKRKDNTVVHIPTFKFITRSVTNFTRKRTVCTFELHVAVVLPSESDQRSLVDRLSRDVDDIFNEDIGNVLPRLIAKRVEFVSSEKRVHKFIIRFILGDYVSEIALLSAKSETALRLRERLSDLQFVQKM